MLQLGECELVSRLLKRKINSYQKKSDNSLSKSRRIKDVSRKMMEWRHMKVMVIVKEGQTAKMLRTIFLRIKWSCFRSR